LCEQGFAPLQFKHLLLNAGEMLRRFTLRVSELTHIIRHQWTVGVIVKIACTWVVCEWVQLAAKWLCFVKGATCATEILAASLDANVSESLAFFGR